MKYLPFACFSVFVLWAVLATHHQHQIAKAHLPWRDSPDPAWSIETTLPNGQPYREFGVFLTLKDCEADLPAEKARLNVTSASCVFKRGCPAMYSATYSDQPPVDSWLALPGCPWWGQTVQPSGKTYRVGVWAAREECETAIKVAEEQNHAHGSFCTKDKTVTTP